MKVTATDNGLVLQLSQVEMQRVATTAKIMRITPRKLLDTYAETMSANFLQDIDDIVLELDDEN